MKTKIFYLILGLLLSTASLAKTLQFSMASKEELNSFIEGNSEDILQFKEGDKIAINLTVAGDLLQTIPSTPVFSEVKKGFFIKMEDDDLLLSWDGQEFKPFKDYVGGKISVNASGSPVVTAINLLFAFTIKN